MSGSEEIEILPNEFICWENNQWGLSHNKEQNLIYIREFLKFKESIENCEHEWINYGLHRIKCTKCPHITFKS